MTTLLKEAFERAAQEALEEFRAGRTTPLDFDRE
jgi:hypothetical protein